MINKLVVLLVAAGMSMTLCAMPTAEEQEKVRPLVQGLMKPDLDAMKQGKKSRSDVAKSAMDLYSKADSPAAKMLLARNAFNLYAKAGEYEAAEASLDALLTAVPDYPAPDVAELIEKSLHSLPSRAAPNLRARLAAIKDKAQSATQLKKLLSAYETLAEGPKRKACAARIASAYAVLDDWPNANKYFAVSDSPAAAAATVELKLQNEPEASRSYDKAADAWWAVELPKKDARLSSAIRSRAAALYAKALPSLKGLAKVQAERRVQEVEESAAEAASAKSEGSSSASAKSASMSKSYGVELIGKSIMEKRGVLSGFASKTCAKVQVPFEPKNNSIEAVIHFETGDVLDKGAGILSSMINCGFTPLYVIGGELRCYLSSKGAAWDIANGAHVNLALNPKTKYLIKVTWDGKVYSWWLKDGDNWRKLSSLSNDANVFGTELQLGNNRELSQPFSGTIDLNKSYICIGGKLVWEGVKGAYRNANR